MCPSCGSRRVTVVSEPPSNTRGGRLGLVYPQAQENDAERAVKAALAIQRALSDLNARNAAKGAPELSARVGIESGPVVVEASGEVFGDAPNVAARVQAENAPRCKTLTSCLLQLSDRGAPYAFYLVIARSAVCGRPFLRSSPNCD
jgi:hypothetical protein